MANTLSAHGIQTSDLQIVPPIPCGSFLWVTVSSPNLQFSNCCLLIPCGGKEVQLLDQPGHQGNNTSVVHSDAMFFTFCLVFWYITMFPINHNRQATFYYTIGFKITLPSQVVVVHTFNLFKVSLVYRVSSRTGFKSTQEKITFPHQPKRTYYKHRKASQATV